MWLNIIHYYTSKVLTRNLLGAYLSNTKARKSAWLRTNYFIALILLTCNSELGPWCAVAVFRNSAGILQILCPPCLLSGCCHQHHLVRPDPQSSARRNSLSPDAATVRRVHNINYIYWLSTVSVTQCGLQFGFIEPPGFSMMLWGYCTN